MSIRLEPSQRGALPLTLCIVLGCILVVAMSFSSKAQTTQKAVTSPDEQSCRTFVQKFYDWYWNQPSNTINGHRPSVRDFPSYSDARQLKPPILSRQLIELIEKDEEASKAAGGDIVNLDFDPFLNSNGPDGKYLVKTVNVVDGVCQAAIEGGHGVHETAELEKTGSAWLFVNFHYSYYSEDGKKKQFPDNDLIHILSR